MTDSIKVQPTVARDAVSIEGDRQVIPARRVLAAAIRTNQCLGHENLGFLSETHGFMPVQPPLLALPSTHELWDCMAAELPDLCRRLRLRQRLDTMPVLSADVDNLPDRFLLRASTILGAFAHAYYYIDANAAPPSALPAAIEQPWEEISQRLHRRAAHMSYIDMSTYNWRWIDPRRADPMRVENLRLLVPIWGNEEERIFLGSTIEIQAQSTPLLGAIVRAQEAVWQDNPERLEQELAVIIDCLNHLTYVCLPKVVPNARSAFFVDPVVWAKTTAPLAVPIRKGSAGPVGAATMSLQVLDAFLERRKYASDIGRESIHVREWFPQHWVDFYGAVWEISVPTYIQQKRMPVLTQLFQEVLHAYAGDTGFLGRHRLKAYGYIETAFKSGRPATAAFRGSFKNRVWENIDAQLELARQERYDRPFAQAAYHQARIQEVVPTSDRGDVARVTLTLEGSCAYYHPGDRCAILPENHADLVEKTLKALQAEGSESIQLDETWQLALQYRPLHRGAQRLALRSLLTFGQIRPLRRPVARLLLDLVRDTPAATVLERVLHAHTEEEWELWDMLEQLQVEGFDPRTLWQPGREVGELPLDSKPQSPAIAQVVPPESFRLYSISSVMAASVGLPADLKVGDRGSTTEVQLTVGVLQYQTTERTADSLDPRPHKIEIDCQPTPPITRRGTASQFLTSFLTSGAWGQIVIKIVPSPRFHLPPDSTRPILMFAGGTGISPFRSFLLERTAGAGEAQGENWLFFSIATRADIHYQDELMEWVAAGKLRLNLVLSREDIAATTLAEGTTAKVQFVAGARCRVGDVMRQAEYACKLRHFLRERSQGGLGAYIYICGQTGFATSVMDALQQVLAEEGEGSLEERQQVAQQTLERLVAEGRCMQETFTPFTSAGDRDRLYDLSEIVLHNTEAQGYWMIIDDAVYDVTSFSHQHPGGFKILRAYAGMDATAAYQKVRHHADGEIQAMLAGYRIGIVRPFVNTRGCPEVDRLYQNWSCYLLAIVEIENALGNDFSLQREAATHNEVGGVPSISPAKLMMYGKSHQRFLLEFLPQILEGNFPEVLAATQTFYGVDFQWLLEAIAQVQQAPSARGALEAYDGFVARLTTCIQTNPDDVEVLEDLHQYCTNLEQSDMQFLQKFKQILCQIVQLFEQFGDDITLPEVRSRLWQISREIPQVLNYYYKEVALSVEVL